MTDDRNEIADLAATAEHQRAELAGTVEALAGRADLTGRAKESARTELERVRRDPKLAALLGGTVAGILTVATLRRIRSRRHH
ncbi:hypothetical protein ACFYVR_19400 [Rhodococcus sp. NPDC003318]|uniref:hypothetical protein n=1 Tax=Rhodococcus sp. NPDC003318 TaxID=3364503 RepID=UPI0036913A28